MNTRTRIAISAVAVAAMCLFIFAMSAAPADDSDALSLGFAWHIVSFLVPGYADLPAAEQLEWQHMLNHPIRKAAHFTEYAVLGALVLNLMLQIRRNRAPGSALRSAVLPAWAFSVAYAATDEIHQLFVPGRAGMLTDVMIDAAGALCGVLLLWAVLKLALSRHRSLPNLR